MLKFRNLDKSNGMNKCEKNVWKKFGIRQGIDDYFDDMIMTMPKLPH